jgi:hypothetical protein
MATDTYSVTDSIGLTDEQHTLTGSMEAVEIVNIEGAGHVTYRFDGTAAVLGAVGTECLAKQAGARNVHRVRRGSSGTLTINLIAATATIVLIRKVPMPSRGVNPGT